jgi:fructose-bisphosphate aldolase class I
LEIWHGKQANVSAAQQAFNHRARCNRAARRGEYNAAMESDQRETALPGVASVKHAGSVQ